MKGAYKLFLLIAGLLLLLAALSIFAFGLYRAPSANAPEDETSRYTAALKLVANANVHQPDPTPTPPPDTPANTKPTPLPTQSLQPTPAPSPVSTPTPASSPPPTPEPTPQPSPRPTLPPVNVKWVGVKCQLSDGAVQAFRSSGNSFGFGSSCRVKADDGTVKEGSVISIVELTSRTCKYTSGPRAGQTDSALLPNRPSLGSFCGDGQGNTGAVVVFAPDFPQLKLSFPPANTPRPGTLLPTLTPSPAPGNSPQGRGANDYSFRYAAATQPQPAVPAPPVAEKDNVDMCYPATISPGEGKNVTLRLIRAPGPVIDDFCPLTSNKKKDVKNLLPASLDTSAPAEVDPLLKDFCASKGASYEPWAAAELTSSSFKVVSDPSRLRQSLLLTRQEWDFSIKAEDGVAGDQELLFSFRVDCVNKQNTSDVVTHQLHFSDSSFKIAVVKKAAPLLEFGALNITGLLTTLLGSVFCAPFLSDRIKIWRENRTNKRRRRAGF